MSLKEVRQLARKYDLLAEDMSPGKGYIYFMSVGTNMLFISGDGDDDEPVLPEEADSPVYWCVLDIESNEILKDGLHESFKDLLAFRVFLDRCGVY